MRPLSAACFLVALASACSIVNRPADPEAPEEEDDGGGGGAGGASTSCGDGRVDPGEDCDTGGESTTCDADCTAASCGDGTVNAAAGESCDIAGASASCDADCTAAECGDGVLNAAAGERCDDGNTAPDDGCDAACAPEGTCAAPLPLAFNAATGNEVATVTAATGGPGEIAAAACDGTPHGAGSERVYRFELTATRRVDIALEAGFNALLRVQSAACDPMTEVPTAPSDDGCAVVDANGQALLSYSTLPPGSYHVVVDGQAANDAGSFQLTVTLRATCLNGDPEVMGYCQLQTVCNLPVADMFCGGNCSSNHDDFAHWWCQLGGYSAAHSYTVVSTGVVQCPYYNGGATAVLNSCTMVMGPTSYGLSASCTAVDNVLCIP